VVLHDAAFALSESLTDTVDMALWTLAEDGDVEAMLRVPPTKITIINPDHVSHLLREQAEPPSDHMDEPLFYRDDLQDYYEAQLLGGADPNEAVDKVKAKFKITKEVVVTPTGELRVKGVTDRPLPLPPEEELPPEDTDTEESISEMAELAQRKGHLGFKGKVFVYFNINLSAKLGTKMWSIKDAKTGRVIGHDTSIVLRNAEFVVGKKGRERVNTEGRKNVHAGVRGFIHNGSPTTTGTEVTYNPYNFETFVTKVGNEPVQSAKLVSMIDKKVWATGITMGESLIEPLHEYQSVGSGTSVGGGTQGGATIGTRGNAASGGGVIPQPFREKFKNPSPEELQAEIDIREGNPKAARLRKIRKEIETLTHNPQRSKAQDYRLEKLFAKIGGVESGGDVALETEGDFDAFMLTSFPTLWDATTISETTQEPQQATLTQEQHSTYRTWRRLHNMDTTGIRSFMRSPDLQEVLKSSRNTKTKGIREGIRGAKKLLALKKHPAEQWDDFDWTTAHRQIRFIEALRKNSAPTLDELERPTRKLYTLKAWGHDPSLRECVTEADIFDARLEEKELRRWVSATAGDSPYPLVSDATLLPPTFQSLREHKSVLTDTTSVWRATVLGEDWYVANTANMYVARPALQETIDALEAFLK
jgi:hypothetical protein